MRTTKISILARIPLLALFLLGCEQEGRGLGLPVVLDAGSVDDLSAPLRTGANIDTRIVEVLLDGSVSSDVRPAVSPDVQLVPDVKPAEIDTQSAGPPDAQPAEKPGVTFDARVIFDSDPNAHCLQGLVDNGYVSPKASCADDVSITKARSLLPGTIESTCRIWIDCFIANACVRQGATLEGSSSVCISCTTAIAQWVAVSTQWWSDLIIPYCPEFFYTYPR